MRGDDKYGNPNPWILTELGAVQSSVQQWARLLCSDCEQRFAKHGEDWIFRHGLRPDGTFPLASVLDNRAPDHAAPKGKTRVYLAANIPEVNIAAIPYFAASMFWRAAIYPWRTDGGYLLKLGRWEEAFRRYLMGETDFPDGAALMVIIREKSMTDRIAYSPVGSRLGMMHVHKFPIPGFAFTLSVSKHLPGWAKNTCMVRGPGNPLVITDGIEESVLQDGRRILAEGLQKIAHMRVHSPKSSGMPRVAVSAPPAIENV
jgi:hypothetical protein